MFKNTFQPQATNFKTRIKKSLQLFGLLKSLILLYSYTMYGHTAVCGMIMRQVLDESHVVLGCEHNYGFKFRGFIYEKALIMGLKKYT